VFCGKLATQPGPLAVDQTELNRTSRFFISFTAAAAANNQWKRKEGKLRTQSMVMF